MAAYQQSGARWAIQVPWDLLFYLGVFTLSKFGQHLTFLIVLWRHDDVINSQNQQNGWKWQNMSVRLRDSGLPFQVDLFRLTFLYPPQTLFGGVYRNHFVRPSVRLCRFRVRSITFICLDESLWNFGRLLHIMRGCAENKNQVCTMNGFQVMGAKRPHPKMYFLYLWSDFRNSFCIGSLLKIST